MTVSEQLRKFIEESGKSRYEIAKECGVTQSALSRFAHGQSLLEGSAIDRICDYLRLELRKRSPQK